jgi:hypothetical protein
MFVVYDVVGYGYGLPGGLLLRGAEQVVLEFDFVHPATLAHPKAIGLKNY